MKRWFAPGFLAVLVLAALLRLPELRLRPMHNDEAVNAVKFGELWKGSGYKYNPNEFHGATLPYSTLPAAWFSGAPDFNALTEASFRAVTVVFGIAVIALLLFLTSEFGRAETWWAALFAALSPAMVFYSRYYIHEMLLIFFTALAATAAWKYSRTGKFFWCALAAVGAALMWATKETFVLALLAFVLAAVSATAWARWRGQPVLAGVARWDFKHLAAAAGVALVVAMVFYSSFFTNPAGLVDAFKTYFPWFHRAEGMSVHDHPWNFYFQRLLFYHIKGGPVWSEALIVGLAVIGFIVALAGRLPDPAQAALARLIAFYTAWMTVIYTLLLYKTPWCLLGFYQGMIFLAGFGAASLLRWCKSPLARAGMTILLLAGTAQLGWQAWRCNFAIDKGGVPYCDSVKNPYTYSQTTPDMFRLMATVNGLAQAAPQGYNTIVEVMSPESCWPLPWYLRRFTRTGYFDDIPAQPLAPIMIVSTGLRAAFDERPDKTHLMAGYFELRPGVFYELYVSLDLWTRYLKTLPQEKRGAN